MRVIYRHKPEKSVTRPHVILWWNPSQKQKQFATREEADAFMAEKQAEGMANGGGEHFSTYAARWLDTNSKNRTTRTQRLYEQRIRLHLIPVFGDIPLNEI